MIENKYRNQVMSSVRAILRAYHDGELGGTRHEEVPELDVGSRELRLYFTLAPALNYQRKSESLWRAARRTFEDGLTQFVFETGNIGMGVDTYRTALTKYGLALQPRRQTKAWLDLSETFEHRFRGDPFNLFEQCNFSVSEIRTFVLADRQAFPYLAGPKLFNYWMYMIDEFTGVEFVDRSAITIIPDVHVRRASVALGVVRQSESEDAAAVAQAWADLLKGEDLAPVDLHAPLWRWSRAGAPDPRSLSRH